MLSQMEINYQQLGLPQVKLNYARIGSGDPVVLVHGFGSTAAVNWVNTGWVSYLLKESFEVIIFDHRGHGGSSRPKGPGAYHPEKMAQDVADLIDFLKIKPAHVIGFSMGARVGAFLAYFFSDHVKSLVMGGLGMGLIEGFDNDKTISEALRAENEKSIEDPQALLFRRFCIQSGNTDLIVMADCLEGSRVRLREEHVKSISAPVQIVVGEQDPIAYGAEKLSKLIPNAKLEVIPRRNHLQSTGDRAFKEGALNFIRGHQR